MLTKNEITTLNLSPTKKDFVQIWNELLEVAGKLSERWDPTSTNESDPGIVILKALTGIADKLNYNIDKNTLEAFMPTAAQEDSMRKLCAMLGYSMKYYRSATTDVLIRYSNPEPSEEEDEVMTPRGILNGLAIPKFTVITNNDKDVNYFTINEEAAFISKKTPSVIIPCMEGQLVKCESSNDDNIITARQIVNNKFYLPETQIAENGIFVYNTLSLDGTTNMDGTPWLAVDNLNIQPRESRVFKFGYDSYASRPYLEFPDDYSELFGDGLFIYYTRTNGVNGNVSARTLTQLELPTTGDWAKVSADSFSAENTFAATNGANSEGIVSAYNNFKKTIGTFDTLVTCRDYMNKIYSMIGDNGSPLVSNANVTDIRNDINRAICICSCDDAGIFYKERAQKTVKQAGLSDKNIEVVAKAVTLDCYKPTYKSGVWYVGSPDNGIKLFADNIAFEDTGFNPTLDGEVAIGADEFTANKWVIVQNGHTYNTGLDATTDITANVPVSIVSNTIEEAIDRFDIVLYPFKTYTQVGQGVKKIREAYERSYTYSIKNKTDIIGRLEPQKTLAHNIISPRKGDLLSINNYIKLNANIVTNYKITNEEGKYIKDNIKIALANAFNLHELDFGEEIPFDSLVSVIENADSRIKSISLNEPTLYTTFSVLKDFDIMTGEPVVVEYAVASEWLGKTDADNTKRLTHNNKSTYDTAEARKIYNHLVVRNILAGRVPLFNYNTTFSTSFSEGPYLIESIIADTVGLVIPNGCTPTKDIPKTIWVDGDITYTGEYTGEESAPIYRQAYVPTVEDFCASPASSLWTDDDFENTPVEETSVPSVTNFSTDLAKNPLTRISAFCKIATDGTTIDDAEQAERDESSDVGMPASTEDTSEAAASQEFVDMELTADGKTISNVTLAESEFIKFRAPNFITEQTYPAYVNYHLKLANGATSSSHGGGSDAVPCEAVTLFSIFNDVDLSVATEKRSRLLNYFTKFDAAAGTKYKKTFSIKQRVYANNEESEDTASNNSGSSFVLDITNSGATSAPANTTTEELILKSGFARLTNNGLKARIEWADKTNKTPIDLSIELDPSYQFITSADQLAGIKTAVDDFLNQQIAEGGTALPDAADWDICFDFECVPFEPASLSAWSSFLRYCARNYDTSNSAELCYGLFSFRPVEHNNNLLWFKKSTNSGDHQPGVQVLSDGTKLQAVTKNIFNTGIADGAGSNYIDNVYIIKYLGKDATVATVKNDAEYTLKDGEYLYIEYTPSSTSADGTTTTSAPVKIVHESGTIIKPSGFEVGVQSSEELLRSGNASSHKTVDFTKADGSVVSIEMLSLGANEQIALRKPAEVVLDNNNFVAYVYKNFNGVSELERPGGKRTYTLKDGEYIFYTDQNKTELAYYSSGTVVTLEGRATIAKCEVIDASKIFDEGISALDWHKLPVYGPADKITFQEFQYVTIGANDTLEELVFTDSNKRYLDSNWAFCKSVKYVAEGEEDVKELPLIDCGNKRPGNGWEACSVFKLQSSPEASQTLRNNDRVKTGIVLSGVDTAGGGVDTDNAIILTPSKNSEMSFKTNVACLSDGSAIDLEDLISDEEQETGYEKIDRFDIKAFHAEEPSIILTPCGQVVSIEPTNEMIAAADGKSLVGNLNKKAYNDIWDSVNLEHLRCAGSYDRALKLTTTTLPNTYGIFSIYVNFLSNFNVTANATDDDSGLAENTDLVWIEVPAGCKDDALTLFNAVDENNKQINLATSEKTRNSQANASRKLFLNPGLNCIKFEGINNIFIKASKDAVGTLYFDSPKLVDCTFKSATGSTALNGYQTKGLNMSKLGYLPIDSDKYADIASANAKGYYVNNATTALKNLENQTSTILQSNAQELVRNKENFEGLIKAEQSLYADLINLSAGLDSAGITWRNVGSGDVCAFLMSQDHERPDATYPSLEQTVLLPTSNDEVTFDLSVLAGIFDKTKGGFDSYFQLVQAYLITPENTAGQELEVTVAGVHSLNGKPVPEAYTKADGMPDKVKITENMLTYTFKIKLAEVKSGSQLRLVFNAYHPREEGKLRWGWRHNIVIDDLVLLSNITGTHNLLGDPGFEAKDLYTSSYWKRCPYSVAGLALNSFINKTTELTKALACLKTVKAAKKQSTALRDVLLSQNATEANTQLIALINELVDNTEAKDALVNELEAVKAAATAAFEDLPEADAITIFKGEYDALKTTADNGDWQKTFKSYFAELSDTAKQELSATFSAKLADLIVKLNTLATDSENRQLTALLEQLKAANSSIEYAALTADVVNLKNALNHETVDDIISELQTAVAVCQYDTVYADLTKLYGIFKTGDVKQLVYRIEERYAEQDYEAFRELVASLNELTTGSNEIIEIFEATGTSSLMAIVETLMKDSSEAAIPDKGLISAVSNLCKKITALYSSNFTAIVESLENKLNKIAKSDLRAVISDVISSFDDEHDEAVAVLLETITDELDAYIETKDELENNLTKLCAGTMDTASGFSPALATAIAKVMPKIINTYWLNYIDTLNIVEYTDTTSLMDAYAEGTAGLTDALKKVLKSDTISQAFLVLDKLLGQVHQDNAFSELAYSLNSLLPTTASLDIAIDDYNTDTDINMASPSEEITHIVNAAKNTKALVNTIINELRYADGNENGITLAAKPEILISLQEALKSNIKRFDRLNTIIEQIIFPQFSTLRLQDFSGAFFDEFKNHRDAFSDALAKFDTDTNVLSNLEDFYYGQLRQDARLLDEAIYEVICQMDLSSFKENSSFSKYTDLLARFDVDPTSGKTLMNAPTKDVMQNFYRYARFVSEVAAANSQLTGSGSASLATILAKVSEILEKWRNNPPVADDVLDFHNKILYVRKVLNDLYNNLTQLSDTGTTTEELSEASALTELEEQLLAEIRQIDIDREFYYNVSTEFNYLLNFNDAKESNNTLMNPATNYDVNNINNNFVVSKLDIGYLDEGLQIARTSRIN